MKHVELFKMTRDMKKFGLFLLAAASLNAFASCDDDDRHESNPQRNGVSELVVKTFNEMYPDAKNIEWEVKNEYAIAEFYSPSGAQGDDENTKAWFDNTLGDWAMTECDIASSAIPQAVLTAFGASEYADWRIDDIDMVLRNGMELVYVLEVEQGERDIDLYYSEDGVLVKSISGLGDNYDYSDFIPKQPTGSVTDWIASNYPDARIVDIDVEYEGTEVEIIDNGQLRELLFGASGSWIYTKTEMRWSRLPSTISQAFQASEYRDYHIDDIDFYQTESGEFYRFDLESRNGDVKIDIATDGQITPASPVIGTTDPNPNIPETPGVVGSDYRTFIESTYPGARILERDYDDGYLEIEIWHDGREKNVYFDGSENWVFTKSDCRFRDLPEVVINSINSQYAHYEVDDIELIESPSGTWYAIELERGDRDINIRIDANGTIL